MFIVGTIEDQGRCSSHPPRVLSSSKKKDKEKRPDTKSETAEKLQLLLVNPPRPAWDDLVSLSNFGKEYKVQIAALHTHLQAVKRANPTPAPSPFTLSSLPPYEPPTAQPSFREDDFRLSAHCLAYLDESSDSTESEATESILLFLYEVRRPQTIRRLLIIRGSPAWFELTVDLSAQLLRSRQQPSSLGRPISGG